MQNFTSKLKLSSKRISIEANKVSIIIKTIFLRLGCSEKMSEEFFDQYIYEPRDLDHFTKTREIIL